MKKVSSIIIHIGKKYFSHKLHDKLKKCRFCTPELSGTCVERKEERGMITLLHNKFPWCFIELVSLYSVEGGGGFCFGSDVYSGKTFACTTDDQIERKEKVCRKTKKNFVNRNQNSINIARHINSIELSSITIHGDAIKGISFYTFF